jgi:hypothetical protein
MSHLVSDCGVVRYISKYRLLKVLDVISKTFDGSGTDVEDPAPGLCLEMQETRVNFSARFIAYFWSPISSFATL